MARSAMANGQLAHLSIMIRRTKFLDDVINAVGEAEELIRSGKKGMHGNFNREDRRFHRFWRTAEDKERMARYSKYRDLWKAAPNTKKSLCFEWQRGIDQDVEYRCVHMLPKVSFDLTMYLLGKGIEVTTQLPKFDNLLNQEFQFSQRVFKWMQEVSVFGFIGLQTVINDKEIDIVRVQPDYLFPKCKKDSDDRFEYIAKRMMVLPEDVEEVWIEVMRRNSRKEYETEPVALVFEERHFKGYIEYYYWVIDTEDRIIGSLPVKWYDTSFESDVVFTGIDDFAITIVHCWEVADSFLGDWDYLYDLLRSINARSTQVGRQLNKSEPKLIVGDENLTKDPRTGRVMLPNYQEFMVYHGDDTTKPEYLQSSADTTSQFDDLKMLYGLVAVIGTLPPQSIDPFSGIVENASAFKMSLTPTLTMLHQRGAPQAEALARFVYNHLRLAFIYGAFDEGDFTDDSQEKGEKFLKRGMEESTYGDSTEEAGADEPSAITESAGSPPGTKDKPEQPVQDGSEEAADSKPRKSEGFKEHKLNKGITTSVMGSDEQVVIMDDKSYQKFKIRNETFQRMLRPERVNVRFIPAVPQDDQALVERAGETASTLRILQEVDGMSLRDAEKEYERIQTENASDTASNNDFGGDQGFQPFGAQQPALDEMGQPIVPTDRVADNQDVVPPPAQQPVPAVV